MTGVHAWWAGWAHYPAPWGLSVAPVDDLYVHDVTGRPCLCGPVMVPTAMPGGAVVFSALHQSLDGRERGYRDGVHVR